ncbi:MAG: TonB-dependent receptor [Thermoflexibacter sp.]
MFSNAIVAQNLIKGKVIDQTNREPIANAVIKVKNTAIQSITDAKGEFEIDSKQLSIKNQQETISHKSTTNNQQLIISHLTYESQEVEIKTNQNFYLIALQANTTQLGEVIVSAYQNNQKFLDIAGAVSVITTKELHRDNDLSIANAINRISGIYMHAGTFTTNRLTIRGIGSRSLFGTNKVRAYFNDIPLTSGDGETSIEDIDLSLIDRVEILKGTNSSIYGAGLGGTVLLHAQKADFSKTSLSSDFFVGSFGLRRNVVSFKTGNANGNFNLTYTNFHTDGYRENNQTDRQSIGLTGQFASGEKTTIAILANYIKLKAFIPSSIDLNTFKNNPRAAAPTWLRSKGYEDYQKGLFGVSIAHQFADNLQNTLSLFSTFRNSDEPRPFNFLREKSFSYGFRNRLNFSPQIKDFKPIFMLGTEYFSEFYAWGTYQNNNQILGNALSDQEEKRNYLNIFAQADLPLTHKIMLSLGLNLNDTDYRYIDLFVGDGKNLSGNYGFKKMISPRLAINYKLNENQSIHANMSHGFSPPTLSETLLPSGAINPNIQPEDGYTYEIGSRGNLLKNKLFYDVAIYSMQISNLLVARRTGDDAFVGVNAGKTQHNGLEINLNYQAIQNEKAFVSHLFFFTNYTLADYKFKEFIDGDNNFSGNMLTGTPKHTFNAGVDANSCLGFYTNLNFQFVDRMPILDNNTLFSEAYQVANAKLGWQKKLFNQLNINIFTYVNNLFDAKYASMILINAAGTPTVPPRYYYPAMPRNYTWGVSVKWEW